MLFVASLLMLRPTLNSVHCILQMLKRAMSAVHCILKMLRRALNAVHSLFPTNALTCNECCLMGLTNA